MYSLVPLPYDYAALEPFIDEATMKLHHDKHHQTYVDNVNKALEGHDDLQKMHGAELISSLDQVPEEIRTKVRNNLGGVLNHNLFWQIMGPVASNKPLSADSKLGSAINQSFGSIEKFQEQFSAKALGHFGSGWAWLVVDDSGKLKITDTSNQDNPLMTGSDSPILCLDVWEHAYYLKYQNKRVEYIKAWWNVVNWTEVEERFISSLE